MTTRRRAREVVLQLLYEADINPGREPQSGRDFIRSRLGGRQALTDFAELLLDGTLLHRQVIDQRLASLATNWAVSRMAITDRNILRLGVYEILHTQTPGPVVISEALLLAARYGDRNSPRFVNGVLDKILHAGHTSVSNSEDLPSV